MGANFLDDLLSIAPNFLAILCIISSSLSVYFFPNLTIAAIIANLIMGVYFLVRAYSATENVADTDPSIDYYKMVGWILTLSAVALGVKMLFIGNKIIPKVSALVLGKKNLKNNSL